MIWVYFRTNYCKYMKDKKKQEYMYIGRATNLSEYGLLEFLSNCVPSQFCVRAAVEMYPNIYNF